MTQPMMLGEWRVDWQSPVEAGSLTLAKNANYEGSFSGEVVRDASPAPEKARVAGDIEDGDFTLEESADGQRITATWSGTVVEGSCGREIRGTWAAAPRSGQAGRSRDFVLSRRAAR